LTVRHRACAVLEQDLDLAAIDDARDDAVAELGVAHELAVSEHEVDAVGPERARGLTGDRVLPGGGELALGARGGGLALGSLARGFRRRSS
jgi:hypothetical protein